jgi:hypothetical protein
MRKARRIFKMLAGNEEISQDFMIPRRKIGNLAGFYDPPQKNRKARRNLTFLAGERHISHDWGVLCGEIKKNAGILISFLLTVIFVFNKVSPVINCNLLHKRFPV